MVQRDIVFHNQIALDTVEDGQLLVDRLFQLQETVLVLKIPLIHITVDAGGRDQVVVLVDLDLFNQGSRAMQHINRLVIYSLINVDIPLLVGQEVLASMTELHHLARR